MAVYAALSKEVCNFVLLRADKPAAEQVSTVHQVVAPWTDLARSR